MGEEPAQPHARRPGPGVTPGVTRVTPGGARARGVVEAGEEVSDPWGGDGAVAGEVGGGVVAAEEGLVGDDELDLDRDRVGAVLPGDPFDEGVGHHLALAAVVAGRAGGVGGGDQRGVRGDGLGHGSSAVR